MTLRRLFCTAAALAVVLAGCTEAGTPTLAPADAAPAASLSGVGVSGVLTFAGMPDLTGVRHAEKFIVAAEGGFVELNGFRVDIPAGALPADTTVTIDLPSDPLHAKRLIAEFGPHGIQFSTPVTLTFPLAGVLLNGDPIEVARWENGGWTSLGGTVDLLGTRLTGTTPHFSAYAGKYVLAGG